MIDSPRSLSFQIVKDYLILDNLTKTEKLFDFPLSQFVFLLALLNFLTLSRASEVTRERVSKVETNKNKSWDFWMKGKKIVSQYNRAEIVDSIFLILFCFYSIFFNETNLWNMYIFNQTGPAYSQQRWITFFYKSLFILEF